MRSIMEWQQACHELSVSKGFWQGGENESLYVKLLLITTEVAEATEELRNGHDAGEVYYPDSGEERQGVIKPEGFPVELADIVIRCFDLAQKVGIDLEHEMERKLAYNWKRGDNRYGGKEV